MAIKFTYKNGVQITLTVSAGGCDGEGVVLELLEQLPHSEFICSPERSGNFWYGYSPQSSSRKKRKAAAKT